jgi:hypothetical protein
VRARFDVARIARELPRQSRVGFLYTARTVGAMTNRVAGFDTRVRLSDAWDTRAQIVGSGTELGDLARLEDRAWSVEVNRSGRHLTTHLHALDIGREFRTEVGFVPRTDIRDLHGEIGWSFRPEGRHLVMWRPEISALHIEDQAGLRLDRRVSGGLEFEWRRRTGLEVGAASGRERLRPGDAPGLTAARDYERREAWLRFETAFVSALSFETEVEVARAIHVEPAAGLAPQAADREGVVLGLTARPSPRFALTASWLGTRLDDVAGGARILDDRISRLRFDWQIDRRLSLRAIAEHDRTEVDPTLTTIEPRDRLNADLLLTWLLNPWSAIYFGTNSNWIDPQSTPGLPAPGGRRNDGRQVFVKASWLFRP